LHEVDRKFKAKGINPGTTADLTVATVLIILMEALSVRCTS
jgi:triphosphoribosyl-dephospho-CoA synthase